MAMLERSKKQKVIINTLLLCFMAATVLMMGLLLHKANYLSSFDEVVNNTVNIGPLKLIAINKQPVAQGGFQASIKFLPGLAAYFAVWLLACWVIIAYRLQHVKAVNYKRYR